MSTDNVAKPLVLYLDMNVWVELAVGSLRGKQRWEYVRARLQDAVDRGRITIPLSGANYLELWHRSSEESREDIGKLMRDLSQYKTISSTFEVRRQEVRNYISRFFGFDIRKISGIDLVGYGASHAFGSPYGRFRFVESLASKDGSVKEGSQVEPPEIWKSLVPEGLKWEWLQLVGTQDVLDNAGVDRTPEHRFGSIYKSEEIGLRKRLQQDPKMRSRLKDLVVMQEIQSLLEDINEICGELERDPHALFLRQNEGLTLQQAMHVFVDSLPSSNTWATLRMLKHRDFTHPWDQHDWTDLSFLSVALPYCDAVITEKRWAHLFKVSGLIKKYKTTVGSRIDDLERILEDTD
ncbi:hypothetical protein SLW73_16015 [Glutamicibacter protophormiae]|uniref:hypothetical protein n=1 Tax=Glutamicibacter protophormiae TaxID=37930 RepID=UPI002A812978|nr:hypothetical protein [Glutamicibacter protophormiae]WPR64377.1 hypothetical protein SLW72_16025 [Glutamicibacter protophormiae]WPR67870.1 hypothetical protein SLW73_16015 [Glutamicibacter protophormiae]